MVVASIILPVFNSELFLEECLNSVLDQTFENFELIIIDDCSTDNSLEIINKYNKVDDRISIHQNKSNQGVSYSRNIGITKAKGEFLFFIDSDDILSPNYLTSLISTQRKFMESFIIAEYQVFEKHISKTKVKTKTRYHYNSKFSYLLKNGYLWNKIFIRKTIIDNNLWMEDYKLREDLIFVIKYAFFVKNFLYLDDVIYFYRKHPLSSSSKLGEEIIDSYLVSKELEKMEIKENLFFYKIKAEIHSSLAIYLLKLKKIDASKLYEKVWLFYLNENKVRFSEFLLMSWKRKIWYILFLLRKNKLEKYYFKLKG
ncbi:Putative glycosyltransferase EpsH [Enterococcus casseliflavus]|uniref:Glycosyltransferase EpsH n=1 Tax=Enterococcus casseliflavus TaxID=37734 RepID=A0A6N3FPT9_ENTCA